MRINLPRDQHADLCDPEEITGAAKKAYQRAVDRHLYPAGTAPVPEYVPDPENSAVMIPVEPRSARLGAEAVHQLREMVHLACITGWSYPYPVEAASFDLIPAMASDAIEAALTEHGLYSVFNGAGPKGTTETEPTSSATSETTAAAPLPE